MTHLLAQEGFASKLNRATEGFDMVILDSGPVLAVPEVRFLAAAVDTTLLVVRDGKASRFDVTGAKRSLDGLSPQGVAVVVNAAPRTGSGYYGTEVKNAPASSPGQRPHRVTHGKPKSAPHSAGTNGVRGSTRS